MARAFFGPPRDGPASGGLQVSVHLVPVFEGRLVVFDVSSAVARGRWLPWAVIDFGQNPYEAASLLADDWLDVALDDLSLVDVLSFETTAGGWELAIVFRAAMAASPAGSGARSPVTTPEGHYDAIGPFDPVDLERWVGGSPGESAPGPVAAQPGGEEPRESTKESLLF
jgi:hypothetical protein